MTPSPLSSIQTLPGTEKPMEPFDIVKVEVEHNKDIGFTAKELYAGLVKVCENPEYRVLRENNTLLVIKNEGGGLAEIYLITADKPAMLAHNFSQFGKALRVAKYKHLKYYTNRRAMVRVLKQLNANITETKLSNGHFLVEIDL